jgi:PAS domain S-box-containing protein
MSKGAAVRDRDQQDRFLRLANAMPQLVWVAAADGAITFVNDQWCEYSGLSLEQTTRTGIVEVLHPDDKRLVSERWRNSLRTGESYEVQCRLRRQSDAAYRWFLVRAVPMREEGGHVVEWLGTATDIDDRVQAETSLRESERRFHSLADDAPAAIFIKDLEGRYVYANRLACEGVGLPEVAGLFDYDLVPSTTADRLRKEDIQLVESRLSVQSEVNLHGRWLLVAKSPLFDADGRAIGVCGMGIDMTRRKRAEEALVEADRRKDAFLAVLAHELRNPLAPIRNSIEAMKLEQLPAAQRQPLEIIERQLATLVRLVDDLLDVSRITSGKLELRMEEVALTEIVDAALETSRPYIDAVGHQVEVTLPAAPTWLFVDRMRMAQVLANLLHNSAKYTQPHGSIRLHAEVDDEGLEIRVHDNGVGIPLQSLDQVFGMFAQMEGVRGRTVGGLGIGLALVKALVEMHGGTVDAHSEGEGQGSTFFVRLPRTALRDAPPTATTDASPQPSATASRRILVVDDNRDSAVSMTMLLELLGHETRQASDGLQAIEATLEFQPEVILMDIGMPNMDGLEATRRIRKLSLPRQPYIVALTGWGQQTDRLLTQDAGVDHHLVKPVALETVTDLLGRLQG